MTAYNGKKVSAGNKNFSLDSPFQKTEEWYRFLNMWNSQTAFLEYAKF